MGPGGPGRWKRGAQQRGAARRGIRSKKVGEIPEFDDHTDSKLYRKMLYEWIRFQDLSHSANPKKLTFGQQILSIVTNVSGSAGERLGHISTLVHADMSRDEFTEIVDHILEILDPQDRESAFLETAKAWKELMAKGHARTQTYDNYWMEYSSLCQQYAYSHGEAAQAPGVQELTALLCVLNARLERTEFTMVLHNAMAYQKTIDGRKDRLSMMRKSITAGPKSLKEVLSQASRYDTPQNVEQTAQSDEHLHAVEQSSTAAAAIPAESSAQHRTYLTDNSEMAAWMKIELSDIDRRSKEAKQILHELQDRVDTSLADDDVTAAFLSDLNKAKAKMDASISSVAICTNGLHALAHSVKNTTKYTTQSLVQQEHNDTNTETGPIITMESVRVALRRLDHEDRALRSGKANVVPKDRSASSADATRTLLSNTQKVECWVCKGPHFAYQNDICRRKLGELKGKSESSGKETSAKSGRRKKKEQASVSSGVNDADTEVPPTSRTLTTVAWAEPPDTAFSNMTLMSNAGFQNISMDSVAIVDGGAKATVVGLANYINISEEQGFAPKILPREEGDWLYHAFGKQGNSSQPQNIIGRCTIPIPIGKGNWLQMRVLVVDGDVPFIIGKDTLQELDAVEAHGREWIQFKTEIGTVRLATDNKNVDGHTRIILDNYSTQYNIAESMVARLTNNSVQSVDIVRRVHRKTHLPPSSMELLMRRTGHWNRQVAEEIGKIVKTCNVCLRSGDPAPSKKFSLSKLHKNFNDRLYMDITYWNKQMILHLVDYATGYSEVAFLRSRRLKPLLQLVQKSWTLRHGCPAELFVDQEFDKDTVQTWALENGVSLIPLPSRRHNKAGPVERKNRVLKDILEKFDQDPNYTKLHFADRLTAACFVSNVLYGNNTLSAFEMARGYTPSIQGSGKRLVPKHAMEACKEMSARRLLAKILRARPHSITNENIAPGDLVLVLVPGGKRKRGHWTEETVASVKSDGSIVCGVGRETKIIAREDVWVLPQNTLARTTVRVQHNAQAPAASATTPFESLSEESNRISSSASSSEEGATSIEIAGTLVAPEANVEAQNIISPQVLAGNGGTTPTAKNQIAESAEAAQMQKDATVRGSEIERLPEGPQREEAELAGVRRSGRARKVNPKYFSNVYTTLAMPLSRDKAEQTALARAYDNFQNAQFYAREAQWIPLWVFDKANKRELEENWFPNMKILSTSELPDKANIIGSHFVYKVKPESTVTTDGSVPVMYILKARLCVHGNRDIERESLRSDAAVVSHTGFRFLYSAAATFGLILAKGDIRGAYTQSGVAKRNVYVQPPRSATSRDVIWLLTATMYGLVSAGRKWQRASDHVLLSLLNLVVILGMPQMFAKTKRNGLMLLIAKYVDDLVVAARNAEWLTFARNGISQSFDVGHWNEAPDELRVNSTVVTQMPDCVQLRMTQFSRDIEAIRIAPGRRKEIQITISSIEERQVRTVAGKLGYLGVSVSPFAAFAASYIQQLIPGMTIAGLKHVNGVVRDVRSL